MKINELSTKIKPTWCPGCGNYGILAALKGALIELNLSPSEILVTYGIGCHGHMANYLATNGFESLHGRPLPVAIGAKIANQRLAVLVSSGDGDAYGEGLSHLINAARGNHDVTLLVHNNGVYGLTTGQASPVSPKGFQSKSTPLGVIETPINPLALALVSGATFVARGFAHDINHLKNLLIKAISHSGFALVDVLQPCITFNRSRPLAWYKKRIYKLEEKKHNQQDFEQALERALENEKMPLGVFYQIKKPTYEELLPQLRKKPLVPQPIKKVEIKQLLEKL